MQESISVIEKNDTQKRTVTLHVAQVHKGMKYQNIHFRDATHSKFTHYKYQVLAEVHVAGINSGRSGHAPLPGIVCM